MRTYLNTLLHRKRAEYGPLWLFELDAETWAIVWNGWLEDEDICYAILSEDSHLFNREWGKDGRRPNPTYKTRGAALEEIIRSLRTMKADLKADEADLRKYALYISVAEHDLHQALLKDQEYDEVPVGGLKVPGQAYSPVAPEAPERAEALEPVQPQPESRKTPPAPVAQAAEVKRMPWDNPTVKPTGLNFQPDASLHAKMEWVCNNVPKMSRLRILREGAMLLCDQLIAKYHRH